MPALLKKASQGKASYHGLEVTDNVTWQGWEPGREYTKHIVLQNVKVKTQKLKYKAPESRFFTTLYPQPIVLSAGTSFSLPITFRPLEKIIYNDKIEFSTAEGKFQIPVRAVLPQYKMEAPDHLHFDMCAAHDFIQQTFEIKNHSELVTPFSVECCEPFTVRPSDGVLQPFAVQTLTATFKPKAAVVYEAKTVIKYGGDLSYAVTTMLEGIGKYPHLLVAGSSSDDNQSTLVQFGAVPVGKSTEKWIELRNLSPVNAPFSIDHPTAQSRIDTVFDCRQKQGVVPANGSVRIPITFCPNTLNAKSVDYLYVKALGNISRTVVKCTGQSKGPKVTLSTHAINFQQVDFGKHGTRALDIINESDIDATFQFGLDCYESVFKFEVTCGVVPAKSSKTIIITFLPNHPINYYRRVSCLVHNQDPIFVDLLGTCHTETSKPAVLQEKHVIKYRVHAERGLSFIAPDTLNQMKKEGKLEEDLTGCYYESGTVPSEFPPRLQAMDEYFNDGYYSDIVMNQPHISMDTNHADFGNVTSAQNIQDKTITVTNHTHGKVTVVWNTDDSRVFHVTPEEVDIPPLKSTSFRVAFRPNAPNQFFGAELEGFVYYKSLRDYRLTEDNTHCPPWCLNVKATGQTFQPKMETFLPRFSIDSPKLVFPAVNANEATYRTVLLSNQGTTPIYYDFEKDQTGIYSMKPTKGLIEAGHHQVFVVKVLPQEVKTYRHTLKLHLNDDEKNTQELQAWGSAEIAEVFLDNEATVYFKPTCVGVETKRCYAVKNTSRIPLLFEWKRNHRDKDIIRIEPEKGLIQPNESQVHHWYFRPTAEEKYVCKPSLITWGEGQGAGSSGGQLRQYSVRAVGEGSHGDITVERSYVDFGNVIVSSSESKQIVLVNNSECSLHYKLHVDQRIEGPYAEEYTRHDTIGLELDRYSGVLPARSRHLIVATVRPARRVYYQWTVSCTLLSNTGEVVAQAEDEKTHLCHILATGVFPCMAITDARCFGSARGLGKKQLWNLFSLDNLNICLDSDPSAAELMYDVATRHSHNRRPPVYTRAIMDFNFSSAPVGSDDCMVQLMLENTGAVTCDWALLLPSDLQIELEYWAETGEFDEEELHEMKVMDNRVFDISPSTGRLAPGQTQTISLTYSHQTPGTDRLPVLLKLARGREILLNFVGVTVEEGRPYIHFPSNKHMFVPVAIGNRNSPKQSYELYNGGSVPVQYEIDLAALHIIQEENFEEDVFECFNPTGEILPGQTKMVEWRFSPLEAKTYMVDVPIHIHNGDTAVITFIGVGFDSRLMGDTMPLGDSHHELAGVPSVQSVQPSQQLCYLSLERISFNNVPLYTKSRRLTMLINRSLEHSVTFRWHITNPDHSEMVTVSPACGTLDPGEGKICRVTFMAIGLPSFYDLNLICEITNLTAYSSYEQQLADWREEKRRQQVEFTVTEDDINADQRIRSAHSLSEDRPPSRLKSIDGRTPTPDSDPDAEFIKYRTLPPIKNCLLDTDTKKQRGKKRFEENFWPMPQPPRPFLLHLGVTARSHSVLDFQQEFPDQVKHFFVDRSLSERQAGMRNEDTTYRAKTVSCMSTEADVVASAITDILRGLLDDTEFHNSCATVTNSAIPHYVQFVSHPLPHPLTPIRLTTPALSTTRSDPQDSSRIPPLLPGVVEGDDHNRESPHRVAIIDSGRSQRSTSTGSQRTAPRPLASTPKAESPMDSPMTDRQQYSNNEQIKQLPEFGSLVECLVENTMVNILQEAFSSEFNITARPRMVALPPKAKVTPRSRVNSPMIKQN